MGETKNYYRVLMMGNILEMATQKNWKGDDIINVYEEV
jgi:hypothetical protein